MGPERKPQQNHPCWLLAAVGFIFPFAISSFLIFKFSDLQPFHVHNL